MSKHFTDALMVSGVLIISTCAMPLQEANSGVTQKSVDEPYSVARRNNMSLNDAYRERVEAQIKEWEAEIAKWKAKAEVSAADAKIEYFKQVEGLKPRIESAKLKLDDMKARLQELKADSGDAWDELKKGLDKASSEISSTMGDLRHSFDAAASKFNRDETASVSKPPEYKNVGPM